MVVKDNYRDFKIAGEQTISKLDFQDWVNYFESHLESDYCILEFSIPDLSTTHNKNSTIINESITKVAMVINKQLASLLHNLFQDFRLDKVSDINNFSKEELTDMKLKARMFQILKATQSILIIGDTTEFMDTIKSDGTETIVGTLKNTYTNISSFMGINNEFGLLIDEVLEYKKELKLCRKNEQLIMNGF